MKQVTPEQAKLIGETLKAMELEMQDDRKYFTSENPEASALELVCACLLRQIACVRAGIYR